MSHLPTATRMLAVMAAGTALTLLAACGGSGGGGTAQGSGSPSPASSSAPAPSGTPAPKRAARPPGVVAVTRAGALVLLSPRHGQVVRTLVGSGVLGDEITVSPDSATVYYAVRHGCLGQVQSVPMAGGTPTVIADGTLPAISPDGTRLAYATVPLPNQRCQTSGGNPTQQYTMVIRTLSTGTQAVYPMLPSGQNTGLPAPISHLSWSRDGSSIAVSIASVQDNEGWNLVLVNTATAKDYLSGPGDVSVPVTGSPSAQRSYLREGVYMPNGNLFVSRACCGGFPVHNTSRLMWVVNTEGVLQHQVAIGFASLDHTSLAASRNGAWLLYLAGNILYISHKGNKPVQLTSGMIAAAWR
jgi:hypothetical protein